MKQVFIDLFKKITKLIDLKSFITMALVGALVWGFIVGKVDTKDFLVYVGIVITFYFAKKEGDDKMATVDTRTEEEIKEDLEKGKEE